MNKGHRAQVSGLVHETVRCAMVEDFSFRNEKEAKEALEELKRQVNTITVDDIYFEDEDE